VGQGRVSVGPWVQDEGVSLPAERLHDVDVLFCELPPANFDDFKQLKWIQLTSAGYGQVLELPIIERGIRVSNGLGTFDVPIAEWNVMMMLAWHRRLPELLRHQRDKIFERAPRFQQQLRGATVGFYGYGSIARETARLCKAMGLTVWALNRAAPADRTGVSYCLEGTGDQAATLPDQLFTPDQKREFLGGVDYLVITVPLTPATRGLIGEAELRMLKPSAVLINCARAAVIDENAYVRGLRENWFRGSSLDVHYAYPLPPQHPLWEMPNLIMTPHISGGSDGAQFLPRTYEIFAGNLERFVAGKPLLNELSKAQLAGK
jgi:phosphoglycerate dehydrogenase-like enzyme